MLLSVKAAWKGSCGSGEAERDVTAPLNHGEATARNAEIITLKLSTIATKHKMSQTYGNSFGDILFYRQSDIAISSTRSIRHKELRGKVARSRLIHNVINEGPVHAVR